MAAEKMISDFRRLNKSVPDVDLKPKITGNFKSGPVSKYVSV